MYVLCTYVDFSYIPVAFSVGNIVVAVVTSVVDVSAIDVSVVGTVVNVLLVVGTLVELVGPGIAVGGILVCSNITCVY